MVESTRLLVAERGFGAWSRSAPVTVPFDEPVVLAGVQVGTLIGSISLFPADDGMCRTNFANSKLGRPGRAADEVFALQGHAEAQMEGDKQWRKVWVLLSFSGLLYVLPKSPAQLGTTLGWYFFL